MRCAALLLAMHFVENRSLISCIQLIRLNKRVIVHDEREFSAFNWLFSWLSEKSTRMVQSHWPDAFDCIYTHYTAVASIVFVVVMCRPSGSCVACLFNLENAFFNFLRFNSPLYIQTNHFATHFSARQTYSIHKTNNTTKCKKKKRLISKARNHVSCSFAIIRSTPSDWKQCCWERNRFGQIQREQAEQSNNNNNIKQTF